MNLETLNESLKFFDINIEKSSDEERKGDHENPILEQSISFIQIHCRFVVGGVSLFKSQRWYQTSLLIPYRDGQRHSHVPSLQHLLLLPGVPPSDINNLIFGEGKNVGEFLAPAMFIHQGTIQLVLTTVSMEPPLLGLGVYFTPNMVSVI